MGGQELHKMEVAFLTMIDFNLTVTTIRFLEFFELIEKDKEKKEKDQRMRMRMRQTKYRSNQIITSKAVYETIMSRKNQTYINTN